MSAKAISLIKRPNILAGIDSVLNDFKVASLTKQESKVLFDYIKSGAEIELEYSPTILSPKKFLFPQEEVLINYTAEGKISPHIEANPLVLFGLRPCDINAIHVLDEAFADGHGDPNYMRKRENTIIVGIDCEKICDKTAFCAKVKAHEAKAGFDIMLTPVADDFIMEVVTEKGEKFAQYFDVDAAEELALQEFKERKENNFASEKPFAKLDQFPEIFASGEDHPVWDEESKRCLSCGSCIMVCPTCYCFDVADELALNLKQGERLRRWDACMLRDFAIVAGGENFRHQAKKRLQHRIHRKFEYLMEKHGQSGCVGCGRCVRACLAEISPKTIAETLNGEKE